MVQENLQQLVSKITESGKITKEELDAKIREKMDALSGLISEEGAIHIIANELGVVLGSSASTTPSKVKEITPGMRSVTVIVKVIKKYELRSFGADGSGKVGSLFTGDETGNIRLTFWNDKTQYFEKINEGDILEIQNAYSRENNGYTELHMGNSSHCVVNPQGKEVSLPERNQSDVPSTPDKKINELTDEDTFVNVTATIVQVYDPRFFESCPTCNKRMREQEGAFVCAEHGVLEPTYNYVMNIFLDDGTDNIRAALWKEQIQQLLEKTDSDILALKDNQENLEEVKRDLLGKIITARARVKKNEQYNNRELVLYQINPNPKPATEAKPEVKETPVLSTAPTAPKTKEENPVEAPSANDVSEELMGDDDEELMSIDDIDSDI